MKKLLFVLGLIGSLVYADTTTPNLGLTLPSLDPTDVWGGKLNDNFSIIDSSVISLSADNTFTGANTFTGVTTFSQPLSLSPSTGYGISALTAQNNSIFLGPGSGNASSQYSICLGVDSCTNAAMGLSSIGIGFFSATGSLGIENIAIGDQTLGQSATVGPNNIAIGQNAMSAANYVGTENNTAIGQAALQHITSYGESTAIGWNALNANTDGFENVAIGVDALRANTTGFRNVAIGDQALIYNKGGVANTAIGDEAGGIAIGYPTQSDITPNPFDLDNTYIGSQTGTISSMTVVSGATAIGFHALVGCSDCIALGSSLNTNFVGVNISTPVYNLEVRGSSGTYSEAGFIMPDLTSAAIKASIPLKIKQIVGCSNCTTVPVCISTGVLVGQWSLITNKGSACN